MWEGKISQKPQGFNAGEHVWVQTPEGFFSPEREREKDGEKDRGGAGINSVEAQTLRQPDNMGQQSHGHLDPAATSFPPVNKW